MGSNHTQPQPAETRVFLMGVVLFCTPTVGVLGSKLGADRSAEYSASDDAV